MQTMLFVTNQLKVIKIKEESLIHMINPNTLRYKRGIFNGLGTAWKWLSGSLDADDAEYYDKILEQTKFDDKEIQLLMKDQIQIIKTTISNFNDSVKILQLSEATINENIRKIDKFAEQIVDETTGLRHLQIANSHLNLLSYLTNELSEQFDTLISAVLFAKNNIIHPSIITPTNLVRTLLKDAKLTLEGTHFPFEINENNIHKLMDVIKLSSYYNNHKIVFVIKIPLTNIQIFNLYNLVPFPFPHHGNEYYAFIQPKSKFLALSENKAFYVQLYNLNDCQTITSSERICSGQTIHSILKDTVCEIDLISNYIDKIPDDCNTKLLKGTFRIWNKLLNTNQWLFVLSEPEILTINCPNQTQISDEKLSNIGILQLDVGCKAYAKDVQLFAKNKITTEYVNVLPKIPIIEDDCCNTKKINSTIDHISLNPIHFTNVNLDELNMASHKLNALNDHMSEIYNRPHLIKHASWYSIIISVVASIVFLAIIYKMLQWCGIIFLLKRFCKCSSQNESRGCCVKIYNQCHSRNNPNVVHHRESRELLPIDSGAFPNLTQREAIYNSPQNRKSRLTTKFDD